MSKQKIFSIISLAISIILLIGLFTFIVSCPVAEGEKPMKCVWTIEALKGLAVLMSVMSFVKFFSEYKVAKGVNIAEIGIGIYGLALIYVLIGTCMVTEMVCNTSLKPIGSLILVLYLLVNVVGYFIGKEDN